MLEKKREGEKKRKETKAEGGEARTENPYSFIQPLYLMS
jgi:hypothetical protein